MQFEFSGFDCDDYAPRYEMHLTTMTCSILLCLLVLFEYTCAVNLGALRQSLPFLSTTEDLDRIPQAPNALKEVDPPIFKTVHALFDSLSRRSGCFNRATRELISECADLSSDVHESLKGKYAIALTLCELSSAGLTGPSACQSTYTERDTARCILALESKPQW